MPCSVELRFLVVESPSVALRCWWWRFGRRLPQGTRISHCPGGLDEPRKAYQVQYTRLPSAVAKRVVLTAPLNESIAQAGFFIEMALASTTPVAILDTKHPKWLRIELLVNARQDTAMRSRAPSLPGSDASVKRRLLRPQRLMPRSDHSIASNG
jgi:hypothetical protein